MPLGNLLQGLRGPAFLVESCEIAIEIPFEFVIKNNALRTTARRFDPFDFRLIQAVEVRIVFGFARLGKSVIDGVLVWHAPRFPDNPCTPFGKGEQTSRVVRPKGKSLFG
jgi:hypothetical protein